MKNLLKVGTRSSRLALAQTGLVIAELSDRFPELEFKIETIKTEADTIPLSSNSKIDMKTAVTRNIEKSLLAGDIDVAIHSLKDLPNQPTNGLTLAATPSRGDARDAFISRSGEVLLDLPSHAKIGTSSLRRCSQVLSFRPDIQFVNIRGNVDTRIRKLEENNYDGIILSAAGLIRLDIKDKITETLPIETMLPSPGQGALAVQVNTNNESVVKIVEEIDDFNTRSTTTAERSFSESLGGDCYVPLAAYAISSGDRLILHGLLANISGTNILRDKYEGSIYNPTEVGKKLAENILCHGGKEILAEIS